MSNLIPKSPSNLVIIVLLFQSYFYSGLEILKKLTLCTVQCVPLAHFIVHCRIALVTVSADWPSCRSLSRSCQIPSPSPVFWSQGRRNWGGGTGGLGGLPPPPQFWWPFVKTFYLKWPSKGLLISKGLLGVIVLTKKPTNFLRISTLASKKS